MNIMIITTFFIVVSGVNAFTLPPRMRTIMRFPVITQEPNMAMKPILERREEIFNTFEPLSNNFAQKFKQENEDICKYISITEIDIYVSIGLMKASEQLTSTDVPSVFAKYCIHSEVRAGIELVLEIQSQEYINEWKNKQQYIQESENEKSYWGIKNQYVLEHIQEHFKETSKLNKNENEKDVISLITYLGLWEYINSLSPILKSAFMRKYSDYVFHPKHMHNGCVVVKSC